jgi:hypothetical protein
MSRELYRARSEAGPLTRHMRSNFTVGRGHKFRVIRLLLTGESQGVRGSYTSRETSAVLDLEVRELNRRGPMNGAPRRVLQ